MHRTPSTNERLSSVTLSIDPKGRNGHADTLEALADDVPQANIDVSRGVVNPTAASLNRR